MNDLLAALCLVMVLEGILPFLAPKTWRETMRQGLELSDRALRTMGLVFMGCGLFFLTLVRHGQ